MKVQELLEKVGAELKDSAGIVAERVKNAMVEKELAAREAAVTAVIGKLEEARRNGKKIKPDGETYAMVDGVPSTTPTFTYSKAKMDEIKKNREEQEKLEAAINKAFDGDFTKVKELAAKAGGKPQDEG